MTANNVQVGGTHYQSAYQHWDFCIDCGFGPLETYITKYALRHERKNGRQDLEKAVHCAGKLLEVFHADPRVPANNRNSVNPTYVRRFLAVNGIDDASTLGRLLRACATWQYETGVLEVLRLSLALLAEWDVSHATTVQVELNLDGGSSAPD